MTDSDPQKNYFIIYITADLAVDHCEGDLKSGSDGRAIAFVTPTEPGAGGVWYGTILFGF